MKQCQLLSREVLGLPTLPLHLDCVQHEFGSLRAVADPNLLHLAISILDCFRPQAEVTYLKHVLKQNQKHQSDVVEYQTMMMHKHVLHYLQQIGKASRVDFHVVSHCSKANLNDSQVLDWFVNVRYERILLRHGC